MRTKCIYKGLNETSPWWLGMTRRCLYDKILWNGISVGLVGELLVGCMDKRKKRYSSLWQGSWGCPENPSEGALPVHAPLTRCWVLIAKHSQLSFLQRGAQAKQDLLLLWERLCASLMLILRRAQPKTGLKVQALTQGERPVLWCNSSSRAFSDHSSHYPTHSHCNSER